jgi:ubiquinone/menaquinone biosynthesis C-methylase UbiE
MRDGKYFRIDTDPTNKMAFHVPSYDQLNFIADQEIDLIWLPYTLHYMELQSVRSSLRSFKRILKQDGKINFNVLDMQALPDLLDSGQSLFRQNIMHYGHKISLYDLLCGKADEKGHIADRSRMKMHYNAESIVSIMHECEFSHVYVMRKSIDLWGDAFVRPLAEGALPTKEIKQPDYGEIMAKRDDVDQKPQMAVDVGFLVDQIVK